MKVTTAKQTEPTFTANSSLLSGYIGMFLLPVGTEMYKKMY
ncbi:hypothetical protein [Colwellia sp. MT41]|nr:hypothetical protein [Colwellia sp. MT41]